MKFAAKMAWRDFKAKPSRYLFYALTVALGSMSLFAVESFRSAILASIRAEGRELLGADVQFRSIRPFTDQQRALVDSWTGSKARLVSYRTMLLKADTGHTRLVEVQAFDPQFPLYGRIHTEPYEASEIFHDEGEILIDQGLALQLDLKPDDLVSVGGKSVRVGGMITRTPGDIPARSLIAPRVFMPITLVDEVRLEQPGVMARFEYYLARNGRDLSGDFVRLIEAARASGLNVETVADRQADLLGSTDRLARYLGLIGFAALAISCLGVMGAVHFFINSKRQTVAQLRCIGSGIWTAFAVFFIQLAGMAVTGAAAGVVAGFAGAHALPSLLADFLPVEIEIHVQYRAAVLSFFTAIWFTILSGALPIIALRHIPPASSLRVEMPGSRAIRMDWPRFLIAVILIASFFLVSMIQLESARMAAVYLAGLTAILLILAATGWLLRTGSVFLVRAVWSYPARLAISGMYRPQNQTLMLVLCIGLGTFLISTVDVLERHIVGDLRALDKDRPNLAMIDVQPDQKQELLDLLAQNDPATVFAEPMITMRLASINGLSISELEKESDRRPEEWALKREFRTTYRDTIKSDIEKVIQGEWVSHVEPEISPVPISLEEGIAEALRVGIGDRISFDIHGVPVDTVVANVREADWKSMQPNFFIVFPSGIIDEAPQSILVFCNISNTQQRAEFQAEVVTRFPNITSIDISLMMEAVTDMTRQLSAGIKSIAMVTLAAGLAVMVAIIRSGRMVRLREAVLLRTIGSRSGTILAYQTLELVFLAMIAAFSGLLLSWGTSWVVVTYGLDFDFNPAFFRPWLMVALLMAMVAVTGALQAAGALRTRPADSWRALSISSS